MVVAVRGSRPPSVPARRARLGSSRDVARSGLTGVFCVPRLWHQLTLQVLDFVQDPCFAQGDGLIKVSGLFPAFLEF